MKKKILGLAMLISALAVFAVFMPAANAAVTSGKCDDYEINYTTYPSTATWTFDDSTGVLTIGGTGYAVFELNTAGSSFKPENVTSLIIENGITTLSGFNNMTNLKSFPNMQNVTKLDNRTFKNCGFKKVIIPSCVTELGYDCFSECAELEYLEFSPNMTAIPVETAMYSMSDSVKKIKTVKIPSKITSMGFSAFLKSDIEDVYYGGTKSNWKTVSAELYQRYDSNSIDGDNPFKNAVIHCTDGDIGVHPAPTNSLYSVANGATTFHVPVTTAAAYKVEVQVKRGENVNANSATASVAAGGDSVDVELPLELCVGDIITIRTTKQN